MAITPDTLSAYHLRVDEFQLSEDAIDTDEVINTGSHYLAAQRLVLKSMADQKMWEGLNHAYLGLLDARIRLLLTDLVETLRVEDPTTLGEPKSLLVVDRKVFLQEFFVTPMVRGHLRSILKELSTLEALSSTRQELENLRALYVEEGTQLTADMQAELLSTRAQLEAALKARDEAEKKAGLDALLGMKNVGAFKERCEQIRSQEAEDDFVVFFWDIDHFRNVNNTYGHKAGDAILQQVTALLYKFFRHDDVFRKGGEELVCVMSEKHGKRNWKALGEAFCEAVRKNKFMLPDGQEINLTISGGMAPGKGKDMYDAEYTPTGEKTLLARADQQVYRAKNTGRDRFWIEGQV